jgi:hypothetical protein
VAAIPGGEVPAALSCPAHNEPRFGRILLTLEGQTVENAQENLRGRVRMSGDVNAAREGADDKITQWPQPASPI